MKAKFFGIPLLGIVIVGIIWFLFRRQQFAASSNQLNTSQSGVPSSGSAGTDVTPGLAGVQSIAPIAAASPSLPPQLTFNLGPQGNAGQQFTTQNIIGEQSAGPFAATPQYAQGSPQTSPTGGCGGNCGGCKDCSVSTSCAINKSNFDGAGACLAPNSRVQIKSLAGKTAMGSTANAAPDPFSKLLSNLFLSGEGPNLSMNALQTIQFGLQEAQGTGREGFETPAAPSLSYSRQPIQPGIPGYSTSWAPSSFGSS